MRIPSRLRPFVWLAALALAAALIGPRLLPLLAPPPSTPAVLEESAGFLDFAASGPARLDADALRALGFDPKADTAPTLRLSWRGTPIPLLPWRTAQGWNVLFYVPEGATRFSPFATLRWERDGASSPMMTRIPAAADAPAAETAWRTLHIEEDTRYLPQATADVPWFWQSLYAPNAFTPDLALSDWAPGPMTVTVRLWSHSSAAGVNPDHIARLYWGDTLIQEWSWDGTGMQTLTAAWTPSAQATLRFETPAIPGITPVVWLDALDVTYTARVRAGSTLWQAQTEALRVADATPESLAWELSDPLAPVLLNPWNPQALRVEPGQRYWFGVPEQVPGPVAWRAAQPLPALAPDTTYLVIAPEAFHAALTPLLEARRAEGLSVALVTPQAAYDAYGDGQPDPQALRALIRSLPHLRYGLLVGDGSAAVDGYAGAAGALRVPTPYVRTFYVGETPADGWLGMDDTGQARVAIGRFPAQTPEDVAAMVAKTLAWEQGGGAQQAVLLSDAEGEFADFINTLQPLLPASDARRVDAGEPDARTRLLDMLGAARTWVTYCGHGSLTQLSKSELLTFEDTWTQPAFFVSWTCLSAYFIHPQQEGLGEIWMRQPRGGVVAFLGPTGETTSGEQSPYAQAFYRALATQTRVGDAWLEALQQGLSGDDARWSFILLGDPALRVRP